jgi:hypothetical protein
MNGLLRLKRKQDNGYEYRNDAAVAIYTWPYTKTREGEVKLMANQAAADQAHGYNPYTTHAWKTIYSLAPRYDFVHKRSDFADADRLQHYSYTLLGKTMYAAHRCFEIAVASKSPKGVNYDRLQGTLYIDTADYAFVAGHIAYYNVQPVIYIDMDTVKLEVEYRKGTDKWTLYAVKRDVAYSRYMKIRSASSAEFVATSLDTANVERFGYNQIVQSADDVQKTNVTVDSTAWQPWAQLFREAEMAGTLRPVEQANRDSLEKQKALFDSAGGGKLAAAIRLLQNIYSYGPAVAHAPVAALPPVKQLSPYMAGLVFNLRVYRPLYVHVTAVTNFGLGGTRMSMTAYALSAHIKLNRQGAPFYLNPSTGFNTLSIKYTDAADKQWQAQHNRWFAGLEFSREFSRKVRAFAAGWYHFGAGNSKVLNGLPLQAERMAWTAGVLLSR